MTHLMEKGGNEEPGGKGRKRNRSERGEAKQRDDRAKRRWRNREGRKRRTGPLVRARYTSLAALIRDDLSPTHGWP